MKADTYIEFQKINARIDALIREWKTFNDVAGDKKAIKAMTADVKKQTKAMEDAIPAEPGTSRRRKS